MLELTDARLKLSAVVVDWVYVFAEFLDLFVDLADLSVYLFNFLQTRLFLSIVLIELSEQFFELTLNRIATLLPISHI